MTSRTKAAAALLAGALLTATAASAANDGAARALSPQDFAYGMTFDTKGSAAAYRSSLRLQVYQGVALPDLADLAVFNGRNEVVPHVLEVPRTHSTVRQPPVSFPVFPLRGNESTALDAVRVTLEASGAKINVQAPAQGATPAPITSYLVDGRALNGAISALQIGWPDDAPQFAGRLKIEASDDLGYWQWVVEAAPIANLRAGESRLVERRVEMRHMRSKYWRLSWVGERAPFDITSVTAEPAGDRADIGRSSVSVEGVPVEARPGEFEFDAGARFPVDRVNLALPELNSVVDVQLFSRPTPKSPWHPVVRSGFYRLKSATAELVNGDVGIAPNFDRYWLARIDARGNGLGSANPRLVVAFAPHNIVFLARGAGPFRLTFGNASAGASTGRISALPSGAHVLDAQLGQRETLGGESRRVPAASAFPGKSTILWTVLGLAVALLAYMAYRLSKDMKR